MRKDGWGRAEGRAREDYYELAEQRCPGGEEVIEALKQKFNEESIARDFPGSDQGIFLI
jgi:hypothetical protein